MRRTDLASSEALHALNRWVPSARLKFLASLALELSGARYGIVRLDPVSACNLRCRMCYFSDAGWRAAHAGRRFTREDLVRIADLFFPRALQVHIGASMEPTAYRDYPMLVGLAKARKVPFVGFTTNGQLLTDRSIDRMAAMGLDEITLSTHGVTRESYEHFMAGASFDVFHETLGRLSRAHARHGRPRIRLNYTANVENLDELAGFGEAFGHYPIATLQVRPVYDLGASDYRQTSLAGALDRYHAVLDRLGEDCRRQGIRLLANRSDPAHQRANASAYVYRTAYLRSIEPDLVWRPDFDWRNETVADYMRRTGWRHRLLRETVNPGLGRPFGREQSAAVDLL